MHWYRLHLPLDIGGEEGLHITIHHGLCDISLPLLQACAREQDAIDACKSIETNHPMRKLKKQAADLRYILEAPKLELSDDEHVKIPIIQSDTWRKE